MTWSDLWQAKHMSVFPCRLWLCHLLCHHGYIVWHYGMVHVDQHTYYWTWVKQSVGLGGWGRPLLLTQPGKTRYSFTILSAQTCPGYLTVSHTRNNHRQNVKNPHLFCCFHSMKRSKLWWKINTASEFCMFYIHVWAANPWQSLWWNDNQFLLDIPC